MPLRAFTRRHYNVLEAGGTIWWWLGGGWCKPRVTPKIAKIRLRIIRVCRINGVLIRMGGLKSPYDPSLVVCIYLQDLHQVTRQVQHIPFLHSGLRTHTHTHKGHQFYMLLIYGDVKAMASL